MFSFCERFEQAHLKFTIKAVGPSKQASKQASIQNKAVRILWLASVIKDFRTTHTNRASNVSYYTSYMHHRYTWKSASHDIVHGKYSIQSCILGNGPDSHKPIILHTCTYTCTCTCKMFNSTNELSYKQTHSVVG